MDASAFSGPLAGVRVIDFGHVWAGPYCAATLADLGAEVIKVESANRLDIHRRQGPYRGASDINGSAVWNLQNRGKRSVTLNLRTEPGRALARRLVAISDVVIENFSPGVMERLGLSYAVLSAETPGIVYASLSAFGQEGPQRDGVGYGPALDAWAGLDSLTAYEDGVPGSLGGVFPDTGSALFAAGAIITALLDRERSGTGQYLDVSELEASALLIGERIVEDLRDPTAHERAGPHLLTLRSAGDDWVFVGGDDAFDPDAAAAAVGVSPAGGSAEAWRRWAGAREAEEIERACLAHGIPAATVRTVAEVVEDPHLADRGYLAVSDEPRIAGLPVYQPIATFSGTPARVGLPAPVLGEGNEYVLGELLGVPDDEIADLVAAHVVE